MIKKLDIYILKKYLTAFFFVNICFVLLICIIDFAEKNDDFMKHEAPMSGVIGDYYLNMIPYLANFLSPLMVFFSTIFINVRLASQTEIIAMLSSGMSFARLLRSYLIGAVILSALTFYFIGWVIPRGNTDRVAFEMEYLQDKKNDDRKNLHVRIAEDQYAYMRYFRGREMKGVDFTLERFEGNHLVYKLKARTVRWDSTTSKWKIGRHSLRTWKDGKETYAAAQPAFDTTLAVSPKDFTAEYKREQLLTIPELKAYVIEKKAKQLPNWEIYEIEYYERFVYPFAIIILTLVGVIVSSRKSRSGIAVSLVLGILYCILYFVVLQLGRGFAQDGVLHPLLAAWLPNLVFAGFGFVMYRLIPK